MSWLKRQGRDFANLALNSWLTLDRRTLGFSRLLLGFYLICDLFRRTNDWEAIYGNKGIQPTWVILNRPQAGGFSLFHGFTTPLELWALWTVLLVTYVGLFIGYRTKLMQVLALVFVTSLNGRVLLIENGGYVVQNLLLLWTAFMPMGDRFSVDALIGSMRRKKETTKDELNDRSGLFDPRALRPFHSVVVLAVCLQIAAIYYFNVVHKTGPDWQRNGTAVHYVLYVDRMVTPIVGNFRDYAPFPILKIMTPFVLFAEAAIAFGVLSPQLVVLGVDIKLWLKRTCFVFIEILHIGFGSSFVLGPFAWALCVFSSLYLSYQDWEVVGKTMRREHRARLVLFRPEVPFELWLCRLLARMDRFGLIGFDHAKGDERGLSVVRPSGEVLTGPRGFSEVFAALPGGPIGALLFRIPPLSILVNWLLSDTEATSRRFGFKKDLGAPSDRSPLRRRFGTVASAMAQIVCAVVLVAEINQALVELWSTKKRWSDTIADLNKEHGWKLEIQPEPLRNIPHKFRFLQGWFMFSPNPVKDDGVIVVDAITVDGRHVDPFTGKAPNFDLIHAKSFGYNQIWSDYFNRIQLPGNRAYRDPMVDYLRLLPERTGNPQDALVSGEIFWVHDFNPRWLSHKSTGQTEALLFSFGESGGAKDAPKAKPKS